MSRHRAVRNINLDEELADDDFDAEENPYEDISEEEHIQLEDSLVQLISLIGGPGDESGFTEREMKDALWDSYFNVDQALNALVEERSKKENRERKKADGEVEEDPTLSALQRLSLQRKGLNGDRLDGNRNVAKGIQGLHFGGRAGLAKKNLARLAPEGLPGTSARTDGWNGFEALDVEKLPSPKGKKRPVDLQSEGGVGLNEEPVGSPATRPSKLAALAAAIPSDGKASASQSASSTGKPLSKLQQKMQANLLARQQKKQAIPSKEDELVQKEKEEEEERNQLSNLPTGDPIASFFPISSKSSKEGEPSDRSSIGYILLPKTKTDLAVPGGSPFQEAGHLEAFSRPSPDDVVLRAREGTSLAKT